MKKTNISPECAKKGSCLYITSDKIDPHTVTMVHEASIEIRLNSAPVIRTQCMADQLEQMAVGFMLCEGLLLKRSELKEVETDLIAGVINVIAEIPGSRLTDLSSHVRLASGGSKTGVIDLMQKKVKNGFVIKSKKTISANTLIELGNRFNSAEGLYRESRFVHSAGLSDGAGILCHCEDVGRHNAVDKALGHGFINEMDFSNLILLCSGRFSLEMVAKVAGVGIPVYISPAAPSAEAVDLAETIGMTLCGRVRKNAAHVYSAYRRVTP